MRKIAFAIASLLLAALVPGGAGRDSAMAATGDTLIVTGDGVNVRYGPSADAKVRMQVSHDQLVSEIERQGDWVRAEIAGTDGVSGWIHASLLAVPSADQLARIHRRAGEPRRAGLPEAKPLAPPSATSSAPARRAPPAAPAKPEASDSSGSRSSIGSQQAAVTPSAGPTDAVDAAELARFRDSVEYLNSRSSSVAGVDLFDDVEVVSDGVVQVGATDAWASIPPGSQQSYANTLVDRWAAARGYSGPATVQIVGPDGKVLLQSNKP